MVAETLDLFADWSLWLRALILMIIFESILPFAAPGKCQGLARYIITLDASSVRTIGLVGMVLALLLAVFFT